MKRLFGRRIYILILLSAVILTAPHLGESLSKYMFSHTKYSNVVIIGNSQSGYYKVKRLKSSYNEGSVQELVEKGNLTVKNVTNKSVEVLRISLNYQRTNASDKEDYLIWFELNYKSDAYTSGPLNCNKQIDTLIFDIPLAQSGIEPIIAQDIFTLRFYTNIPPGIQKQIPIMLNFERLYPTE